MSDRSDRDRLHRFDLDWTALCQAAGIDLVEITAALQRGDGATYQSLARQVMESPAAFNAGIRSIRKKTRSAPVNTLPSRTTRPESGITPNAESASREAQCDVSRLPFKSPAAPSTSAPVQRDVT